MADQVTGTLERDASRRVALVTGGSRGIGRACARSLAREGFDIAIIYAGNREAAADCVQELSKLGATAKAYQCDVANSAQVNDTVKAIIADFGPVWALVNDAGINRDGLLARMKDEDFDAVIDVNLKGAFNMIRALSRNFVRLRGGRIISISSVVGLSGNAGQANYAASKAGLIGLTKAVAKELGRRGVTVNTVAPGFIKTDMTDKLPEKTVRAYQAQIPMNRLGSVDEVGDVVAFLASDAASYITGEVIRVDGGLSM
ncbi:MAG: 3-oxoacyl-[acyl-carrier-protein] reductase [Coriobacteriaceae bacterium]